MGSDKFLRKLDEDIKKSENLEALLIERAYEYANKEIKINRHITSYNYWNRLDLAILEKGISRVLEEETFTKRGESKSLSRALLNNGNIAKLANIQDSCLRTDISWRGLLRRLAKYDNALVEYMSYCFSLVTIDGNVNDMAFLLACGADPNIIPASQKGLPSNMFIIDSVLNDYFYLQGSIKVDPIEITINRLEKCGIPIAMKELIPKLIMASCSKITKKMLAASHHGLTTEELNESFKASEKNHIMNAWRNSAWIARDTREPMKDVWSHCISILEENLFKLEVRSDVIVKSNRRL